MANSDKFRDECGVVAIYSHPEAETLAYLGLHALQHRGQESAGIVTSDGMSLHIHKSMGLVADIFTEKKLSPIRGTLATGHTRYSTTGDSALLNAQPIMVQSNKGMIALAHNGNLTNAQEIRSRMEAQGSIFQTSSDTEVIVHLIAQSREHTLPEAIAGAQLGRGLAIDAPADADLVVPVPDSGVTAAMGYAAESGIPLRFGLIRNHYVGRTFIEPQQTVRDFGVKLKLNPVRSLLEGKRVVLIDDSIVRGTTSRKIVRMVRGAGAKEVHMRISCPPTISPCFYGVDTPRKKELIAANNSVEEIRKYIGADSLSYLSLEGMKKACNDCEKTHSCTALNPGQHPTNHVDIEEIQPATIEKP